MAELVRRAVEQLLGQQTGPTIEDVRGRALAAAGRFRSGAGDLADRHDDYVAEAIEP